MIIIYFNDYYDWLYNLYMRLNLYVIVMCALKIIYDNFPNILYMTILVGL